MEKDARHYNDLAQRVLGGTDGQEFKEFLEDMFYVESPYTKGDPDHTLYRLGQSDVIRLIKDLLGDYDHDRGELERESTRVITSVGRGKELG